MPNINSAPRHVFPIKLSSHRIRYPNSTSRKDKQPLPSQNHKQRASSLSPRYLRFFKKIGNAFKTLWYALRAFFGFSKFTSFQPQQPKNDESSLAGSSFRSVEDTFVEPQLLSPKIPSSLNLIQKECIVPIASEDLKKNVALAFAQNFAQVVMQPINVQEDFCLDSSSINNIIQVFAPKAFSTAQQYIPSAITLPKNSQITLEPLAVTQVETTEENCEYHFKPFTLRFSQPLKITFAAPLHTILSDITSGWQNSLWSMIDASDSIGICAVIINLDERKAIIKTNSSFYNFCLNLAGPFDISPFLPSNQANGTSPSPVLTSNRANSTSPSPVLPSNQANSTSPSPVLTSNQANSTSPSPDNTEKNRILSVLIQYLQTIPTLSHGFNPSDNWQPKLSIASNPKQNEQQPVEIWLGLYQEENNSNLRVGLSCSKNIGDLEDFVETAVDENYLFSIGALLMQAKKIASKHNFGCGHPTFLICGNDKPSSAVESSNNEPSSAIKSGDNEPSSAVEIRSYPVKQPKSFTTFITKL